MEEMQREAEKETKEAMEHNKEAVEKKAGKSG